MVWSFRGVRGRDASRGGDGSGGRAINVKNAMRCIVAGMVRDGGEGVEGESMRREAGLRARNVGALVGDMRAVKVPVWARAREYTDEAMLVIVGVMRDQEASGAVRLSAANVILERGWGKAPIMVAGDSERPIRVDVRAIPREVRDQMESALLAALGDGIREASRPGDGAQDITGTITSRGEGEADGEA